ncbi:hypothetical protein CSOJ01_05901 [Colletotrichum sojae]|uniref:Uncharacterized protein n=1 Tax=Colletotrichum sojae TaxID=2175907 RepID=A0A8H6MWT4_9PEZI|nr:hypothetical protein CSOJ01_05901 [Colletotrichum sojae]
MAKNKKGKSKAAASSDGTKPAVFNPPSEPTFMARDIVTCAENIALLEFLHSTPELPSRNAKSALTTRDASYSLPFEKECALCASFAFIASVRSDPNRIPAVCLEEDSREQVLKILVAVNAGSAGSSSQTLEEIKSGFESILAILGRVSNGAGSQTTTEGEVLRAVVEMCSDRIQQRLRIKQRMNGRKKKSLFKDMLKRAIDDLKAPSVPADLDRSKAAFTTRAKETLNLLTPLEGHPDARTLQAIVESICRLSQTTDLESVISHTLCDKTSRISVLNIIQRVARYKEVARQFYRAAKKFPMVRNSQVVPVRLGPEAFQRVSSLSISPNIESALVSRSVRKDHRKLDQVCRHLASTSSAKSIATANKDFVERCHETLKNGKVHAEIQLLYHYLATPSHKPARVVCSSKDACYLCNTFITMHKAFHTPGCHGRLYPGWRLPSTHLDQTKKFNRVLETRLRESLEILFQRKEKTSYPPPTESSLWTMHLSNTTLASTAPTVPILDHQDDLPPTLEGVTAASVTSDSSVSFSVTGDIIREASPAEENEGPACIIHSEDPMEGVEKTDWAADTSTPELGPTRSRPTAGDSTSHESNESSTPLSGHLVSGETSGLYTEGLLGIQVENVASPASPSNGAPSLGFTIRWLTTEEAELARKNLFVTIVEANCLEGEVSYASTSQNRAVYISHAGQVAEIRLS